MDLRIPRPSEVYTTDVCKAVNAIVKFIYRNSNGCDMQSHRGKIEFTKEQIEKIAIEDGYMRECNFSDWTMWAAGAIISNYGWGFMHSSSPEDADGTYYLTPREEQYETN